MINSRKILFIIYIFLTSSLTAGPKENAWTSLYYDDRCVLAQSTRTNYDENVDVILTVAFVYTSQSYSLSDEMKSLGFKNGEHSFQVSLFFRNRETFKSPKIPVDLDAFGLDYFRWNSDSSGLQYFASQGEGVEKLLQKLRSKTSLTIQLSNESNGKSQIPIVHKDYDISFSMFRACVENVT